MEALRGAPKHGARAQRARALIGEGAYSKAAASLHTEAAEFSAAEQAEWGAALLPCSTRPTAAVSRCVPMERPEGAEVCDEHDIANTGYALQGVKFRAMSAPGPSGARPEHLRELVAVRDRRVASLLLAAVDRFVRTGVAGELCDAARWLLGSRLVFLRKKSGPKARPIRVGEFGRRVMAKRFVHASRERIQHVCLVARQFGVAVACDSEG